LVYGHLAKLHRRFNYPDKAQKAERKATELNLEVQKLYQEQNLDQYSEEEDRIVSINSFFLF